MDGMVICKMVTDSELIRSECEAIQKQAAASAATVDDRTDERPAVYEIGESNLRQPKPTRNSRDCRGCKYVQLSSLQTLDRDFLRGCHKADCFL